MKRTILTVLLFLFMLPLCGVVFVASYIMGLSELKGFNPREIANMAEASRVYDKDGNQLLLLKSTETRVSVPIKDVPKEVVDAFLAVEDTRFYEHQGVDYRRIVGAFVNDIKAGSLKEGASTISQQLIKNAVLTTDKTLKRKLSEAIMAMQLEQVYNKDEILEMYLNYNYFGKGAYGIERAANVYFNKHASELTLNEGATLAAVLKSPTRYAPHLNMDKCIERRDLVLNLMAENNFITPEQAALEKNKPIILRDEPQDQHNFYTDMALEETCRLLNINMDTLLVSGLHIYTAYDPFVTQSVENTFRQSQLFPENAPDGQQCEAAFVIVNNQDGSISAIQGARAYATRFSLNRATSIARQPGSAIKPILVYAPAIEMLNFSPATFILDEPVNFSGYSPRNFSGRTAGWVTMRDAVAKSLNIPAVKVFNMIGVSNAKQFGANVGIPFDPQDDSLTLALGGFTRGVSPLQLAGAYSMFSNGGNHIPPYSIYKIYDKTKSPLYEHENQPVNVISPQTAYLITSMLTSTVEYGTAKRLSLTNVNLAAKTGTATVDNVDGNSDSWIVAYSPEYTACCWLGYDRTDNDHKLPNDITGGTFPAQITRSVFAQLYQDRICPEFKRPMGIVEVKIDSLALEEKKEAQLAGLFTPEEYVMTEYFTKGNAPTVFSTMFQTPFKITDVKAAPDVNGFAIITFTPKQVDVEYTIMRHDLTTDDSDIVHVWRGIDGVASFTDTNIDTTRDYEYYILPKRILGGKTSYGQIGNKAFFAATQEPELP